MEAKQQATTEQSMDNAEIKGKNFLSLIKMKTNDPKSIGQKKSSSKGEIQWRSPAPQNKEK